MGTDQPGSPSKFQNWLQILRRGASGGSWFIPTFRTLRDQGAPGAHRIPYRSRGLATSRAQGAWRPPPPPFPGSGDTGSGWHLGVTCQQTDSPPAGQAPAHQQPPEPVRRGWHGTARRGAAAREGWAGPGRERGGGGCV